MKNLNKTFKTTTYLILALLVTFSFSCSPEDGLNGQDGATGAQGPAGQNGKDGNANVQTYTFDTSSISSNVFSINFPELTQNVINNDAVLTYIKRGNGYYIIPGISHGHLMEVELEPNDLDVYFYNRHNGLSLVPTVGLYELLKVVIIKSTNTNKKASTKKNKSTDVFTQLKNANVDINNYQEVCDYFGIDY